MSKRQCFYTANSTEVQGEGSWVQFRYMSLGESKAIHNQHASTADDMQKAKVGFDLLASHIVGWNWVDNNDQPLPLPKDDPSVMDQLLEPELEFLQRAFSRKEKEKEEEKKASLIA